MPNLLLSHITCPPCESLNRAIDSGLADRERLRLVLWPPTLQVDDIVYSQSTLAPHFTHNDWTYCTTVTHLSSYRKHPTKVPESLRIRLFLDISGKWKSLDNRRLFCYKKSRIKTLHIGYHYRIVCDPSKNTCKCAYEDEGKTGQKQLRTRIKGSTYKDLEPIACYCGGCCPECWHEMDACQCTPPENVQESNVHSASSLIKEPLDTEDTKNEEEPFITPLSLCFAGFFLWFCCKK